jgi:WD40 repeat protein
LQTAFNQKISAMVKTRTVLLQRPAVPLFVLAALGLVGALGFFPFGERLEQHRDRILGKHQLPVLCLAFSPDCKILAAAGGLRDRPGEIKLWDPSTGTEQASLQGHRNRVYALAFSPDGRTLATASFDSTVKLWDVATGRERASLSVPLPRSLSAVLSPDGQTLALLGWEPNNVSLWRTAAGSNGPLARASAPLAFRADSNGIQFWRLLTGVEGSGPPSPEHHRIASADAPGKNFTVKTADVFLGQEALTLRGHEGPVWDVAFSPDGSTIASGSFDKTVKLWDISTGRLCATLCGHTDQVNGVAFSADGKLLASASHDRTVGLWEVATGWEQALFTGHTGAVTCVAFAPNGEWLASGSRDRTVRLWNLAGDQ